MRTIFVFSVLAVSGLCPAPAFAEETIESHVSAYAAATSPTEQFDHLEAALAIQGRTHELDADKGKMVRAYFLSTGIQVIKALPNSVSCSRIQGVVDRCAPYAPTVDEVRSGYEDNAFSTWPAMLLMASVCYTSNENNLPLAKVSYEMARVFESSFPPSVRAQMKKAFGMAAHNLKPSDPLAVGQYLTNGGALQWWIGRVVGRNGKTVRVRLTYAATDSRWAGRRGETISFVESEVKPLKAICFDALTSGWQ